MSLARAPEMHPRSGQPRNRRRAKQAREGEMRSSLAWLLPAACTVLGVYRTVLVHSITISYILSCGIEYLLSLTTLVKWMEVFNGMYVCMLNTAS